ncbi:expressed unknown protein [Seminavis robusta]|uniref:Uncharacterized protein n=1 Tax=Seminavis robusta TaxID=568900 RepID=A0A9N8DQQ5_9STRA|nr:expressed unknown protein [Seminavis robusta]|eukprot:Sro304_g112510.1 n/a (90) ;mRNA; r:6984-7253
MHVKKGDKKLVKALKHIQRAEDSNTIFDKLRIIRNKIPSGGLKHLLVPENPNENPKECQHWRQVDVPEELRHFYKSATDNTLDNQKIAI